MWSFEEIEISRVMAQPVCLSVCTDEDDDTRSFSNSRRASGFPPRSPYPESEAISELFKSRWNETAASRTWHRTRVVNGECELRISNAWLLVLYTGCMNTDWFIFMIHDRAGASRGQPAGGLPNNRATYSNSDSDVNGIHVVSDRYWSVNNDLFVDILGNPFTSRERGSCSWDRCRQNQ